MSIQPGTSLLHYRIIDKLGEGGMGVVWRARDTTLDRDVAVKALPETFALDADRLGRFEREAKLLASLSHPNIAGIFGLHVDQGVRFLAMELVSGEDLSQRLQRGPLPVDEALAIGQRIADGLEYAHERGIIHRDLKPANIKVTPDGNVKVLDFGLAKAIEGSGNISGGPGVGPSGSVPAEGGSSTRFAALPTMTSPAMTQAGIILGTAAYMSPEQARGKPVDKRADNWAFGCVLYEMLTGDHLWSGDTVTDVIAAVVTREPDWSLLPASTPPAVRRLLRRCLDKDPRTRLRDIGEARVVLADPGDGDAAPATASREGRSPAPRGVWLLAAAAALLAGVALGRFALAPVPGPTQAFEFDLTALGHPLETGSFALSPDGSRIALVIRDEAGDRQLAVRDMNVADIRILPGTTGALYPFWSPNGHEIAYFSGNQLLRIAVDGAAPRPIATVVDPRGGAWAPDDVVLVGSALGPIQKVPASGGTALEAVTQVEADVEDGHLWPALLPDGKRFVFLADAQTTEAHRLRLGSLEGGATTILRSGERSQAILDPTGYLLIGERGQLVAYPFDLDSGTLGDESTFVAADVYPVGNNHLLPASVTAGGMVAFEHTSPESQLVMLDLTGRVTRTLGQPDRYGNVAISPDMKRIGFEIFTDTTERLVWAEDLERGVRTPLSARGKQADSTAWAPDSQTVYFDSDAGGYWDIYRMAVTGGGEAEHLGRPDGASEAFVLDVSADGRWLLAGELEAGNRYDLYLLDLEAEARTWTAWLTTPAEEISGAISPDSRWIAYTSDASSRTEVYLAQLAGGPAARRWQLSSAGGTEPRFSPDGKTIYYRSATFDWMAVDVTIEGDTVEPGTPRVLFPIPPMELPWLRNLMDVLPDGSGFLGIHPASNDQLSIRIRTRR